MLNHQLPNKSCILPIATLAVDRQTYKHTYQLAGRQAGRQAGRNENGRCRRLFIMAPCVTALAEALCIHRGALTKIHMCVQFDDASIGF